MEYLPLGGLAVLIIGSIIAVKVELAKRPTFKDTDAKYKDTKVCDEIHKSVDEKLACIPDIKEKVTQIATKIDIFLEANGKK